MAGEAPRHDSERRKDPRVAAARPARIRLNRDSEDLALSCGIVDISQSGIRIAVERNGLPRDWRWNTGDACGMQILVGPSREVAVAAELVWSQHAHGGWDIVGLRFCDLPADVSMVIGGFILTRLNAGLLLEDQPSGSELDQAPAALEIPLEIEARLRDERVAPPFRFAIAALGDRVMSVRHAPKQGESVRVPHVGASLELTVFPPSWARGEKRTLSFAAKVIAADASGAQLGFFAAGSDLARMIRSMIPDRIERPTKPVEVDFAYVLLLLAAVIVALIIARISG